MSHITLMFEATLLRLNNSMSLTTFLKIRHVFCFGHLIASKYLSFNYYQFIQGSNRLLESLEVYVGSLALPGR